MFCVCTFTCDDRKRITRTTEPNNAQRRKIEREKKKRKKVFLLLTDLSLLSKLVGILRYVLLVVIDEWMNLNGNTQILKKQLRLFYGSVEVAACMQQSIVIGCLMHLDLPFVLFQICILYAEYHYYVM